MKAIQCGDWHLGWGFGYHNKIGKLSLDQNTFTWTGRCQGRHGQKGAMYSTSFRLTEYYGEEPRNYEHDWIEYVDNNGSTPVWSELSVAIAELLLTDTKQKIKNIEKTLHKNTQLQLL